MSLPKKLKTVTLPSIRNSKGVLPLLGIDFTIKSCWTDLQLKVEDKYLYVPKSHLAMVSPVFQLMFESDFKEKDLSVLPLPGKKYEDVLTFLKCTHPGALVKVTYDVVPKVLPLAHEYQVKWILEDCIKIMMMEMDTSRFVVKTKYQNYSPRIFTKEESAPFINGCKICIMAEKYDLHSVTERFIELFTSLNYNYYKDLSEFKQISIAVRHRIVCGRLASREDTCY
ncbi:hypothetical protein ACJMK2_028242 [Sinanodonta woodiana]|uniref:BTB domain-containing protein n=1 Tax=Sinanodonta woodiana TaxID=1069815 RepID=A0ABD3X7Z9_SINWO